MSKQSTRRSFLCTGDMRNVVEDPKSRVFLKHLLCDQRASFEQQRTITNGSLVE
jgi:hypothetical protein